MEIDFRNNHPKRTCKTTYKNYRSFKKYLKADFNSRCGYTDCPDFWFGGSKTFHIDHFKPKIKNPKLEVEYSNLVYCCSYVNILKSDDEGDYVDPCDTDLNEHFKRDSDGSIIPISKEGNYMHKNLKLYLKRYQIIWMLEEINIKIQSVKVLVEREVNEVLKDSLLKVLGELAILYWGYTNYLRREQ
jgi:uncharacterized protein (TIGR02646 family)